MSEPALYRHKPTVIRAEQYTRDNLPAVKQFLAERWPGGYQFFAADGSPYADDSSLLLDTLEASPTIYIEQGYWITEGVAGEPYCIRDDLFHRLYERVDGEQ